MELELGTRSTRLRTSLGLARDCRPSRHCQSERSSRVLSCCPHQRQSPSRSIPGPLLLPLGFETGPGFLVLAFLVTTDVCEAPNLGLGLGLDLGAVWGGTRRHHGVCSLPSPSSSPWPSSWSWSWPWSWSWQQRERPQQQLAPCLSPGEKTRHVERLECWGLRVEVNGCYSIY